MIARQPGLALAFHDEGTVVGEKLCVVRATASLEGTLQIPSTDVGYRTAILISRAHPKEAPLVVVTDPAIPRIPARHMDHLGVACLCARPDLRLFWPHGARLAAFVDSLVIPYFTGQFYYQVHGEWPWPDRPHGIAGVLACYRDLIGVEDVEMLGLLLLYRAVGPFPHPRQPCPCQSGKRIRDCHLAQIKTLWDRVDGEAARADLNDIFRHFNLRKAGRQLARSAKREDTLEARYGVSART